jgi:sn-glycerol 3-phosphate transport system substrate-binding protein
MESRGVTAWRVLLYVVCLLVVLGMIGCAGGEDEDGPTTATATPSTSPVAATATEATPAAATPSGETVEISLWHSEQASNLDTLQRLARRFNDSQSDVKVKLAFQGTSDENMVKVLASLQGGGLPTIAYLDEVQAQLLIDSGGFRPMQEFVDQDDYDLSDFDPKTIQFYTVDGKLWAMPISISVPILIYNKLAFTEVGLDPEKPPKDLDELKEASRKFVKRDSHGNLMRTGMSLEISAWYLEVVHAENGELYLDNGNGHEGRATAVEFNGPTGKAFFQWWHDMVKEDLAMDVGRALTSPDALLAVGAGQAVMTRSSTAVLRSVIDALEGGLAGGPVEVGVAGLGGVPGGTGHTAVYTRGLWIAEDISEAEQEAGWKFIKWLMEPQQQAEWFAGSGYLPVRDSSYNLPAAKEIMSKYPQFRVGVEIFRSSPATPATLGPLLGPFNDVRAVVLQQLEETIVNDKDPVEAVNDAAEEANKIIEDYNRRVE